MSNNLTINDTLKLLESRIFEKKVEQKIVEHLEKYISNLNTLKSLISSGLKCDEDFKKCHKLIYSMILNEDLENVKSYFEHYERLNQLINTEIK